MQAIVVGGGIVGLTSAYYLSSRGVEVTVLEKSSIGAGATERAAGGIRAQFETPVSINLSKASIDVWERYETTFETDIGYQQPGYLFLARSDDTAAALRESVAIQNECGVPSEFITPERAAVYSPAIDPDNYVGGTYSPTDGYADPHLALRGFAEAASDAGVEVQTGVEVTDVVRTQDEDGPVSGVETSEGDKTADYVVNAAGAWGAQIAAMAGIDIPITPHRRQIIIVDPATPVQDTVPMTFDYGLSLYFHPNREGAILLGGRFTETDEPADPDTYATDVDFDTGATALERASDFADYFGPNARIKRGWAGLYATTPDYHPVIEETVPGFINAVGFSGHGFMQAPATGQLVAELVVDGTASLVDISELRNERFEHGDLLYDMHGERYG
ncbi:MAG: NAD(P)/FAD-dependent oxidoreductase [Halobacteriales archaeon]